MTWFITFNRGIFFWISYKPRRWLLAGIHRHGLIWHIHCCTRDKPDKSEVKDIIDLLVRHAKGFKLLRVKTGKPKNG